MYENSRKAGNNSKNLKDKIKGKGKLTKKKQYYRSELKDNVAEEIGNLENEQSILRAWKDK